MNYVGWLRDRAAMQQQPLFAPFRALGYITEDVPFAVQRRGKEAWVTVSVGKCWQVQQTGRSCALLVQYDKGFDTCMCRC